MTVTVQVLFDRPQQEIATLLRIRLSQCASALPGRWLYDSGGIEAIAAPLRADPDKLVHPFCRKVAEGMSEVDADWIIPQANRIVAPDAVCPRRSAEPCGSCA